MIINTSYFINKPLFIPKSVIQPSAGFNTPSGNEDLQAYIDEKERCLLLSFLGYEQLTELLNQFESTGEWKQDAVQKWKDLVDGKEAWQGLRYKVLDKKVSLIAYYVYFYFIGEDSKYVTNTGVQKPQDNNSVTVIPNDKQSFAWNEFLRMYGGNKIHALPYSFFSNWNGYGMQWSGNNGGNNNYTSLYEFMTKNSNVYDLSKFTIYTPVNSFGL